MCLKTEYSNPSVYEQSVYEFSLIRDSQINTFFNLQANFRLYELLPSDHCSHREVMGN
jgi:hypothetical protein